MVNRLLEVESLDMFLHQLNYIISWIKCTNSRCITPQAPAKDLVDLGLAPSLFQNYTGNCCIEYNMPTTYYCICF